MPSRANLAAKAQVEAAQAGVETAKAAIVRPRRRSAAAKAAVATAELNLGFTKITSPIDGIAGIAQAQVGNLVSPSSERADHGLDRRSDQGLFHAQRAGISQLRQTQSDRKANGTRANQELELELVLADGTTYPQQGQVLRRRPARWIRRRARSGWPESSRTRAISFAPASTAESAR